MTEVIRMRSPQTMGEDQPTPGMEVFQATLRFVLQAMGNFWLWETPVESSPRNWGQFSCPWAEAKARIMTGKKEVTFMAIFWRLLSDSKHRPGVLAEQLAPDLDLGDKLSNFGNRLRALASIIRAGQVIAIAPIHQLILVAMQKCPRLLLVPFQSSQPGAG